MTRFPRLNAALDYAADAHQNQSRKGTSIPYLSHLMGVSSLVIEHGGDEDQAIAGLLHDVLEDCGAEHEQPIRDSFGDRVATIVVDCTDGVPDASGAKPPWRERKLTYLQHLERVSDDTVLVSACDKLHNARAIVTDLGAGEPVYERFTAGRDGTLWYYQALTDLFRRRLGDSHPLAIELTNTVSRMV